MKTLGVYSRMAFILMVLLATDKYSLVLRILGRSSDEQESEFIRLQMNIPSFCGS